MRRQIMGVVTLGLIAALVVLALSWPTAARDDSSRLRDAFETRQSGLWVESGGQVVRTLPDDLDGSRHQRFIVRLPDGQTLLIAHNIDLAPRLDGVSRGDSVGFRGEYEWNDRGGVIHWTHHDPAGRRAGGWLEWNGRRYR